MDVWVRIFAILVGLASCFYGYPIFRIFLVWSGLLYGYLYGQAFFAAGNPVLAILAGLAVAVVLAVLAYPLWSFGVVAVGAALGFMILGVLGLVMNFPHLGVLLMGLLGALSLGFAFFAARDFFVMVATAFNGAVQTFYGLGLVHGAISFGFGQGNALALLAIGILGATGVAVQYAMFKDRRTYSV